MNKTLELVHNHDNFCRQNESTEQSGKRKDSNAQRMRNTRKSLKNANKRSMTLKKQQYLDSINDGILAEETQVDHDHISNEGSPIPPPRPYNLLRKKINFTMADLQNDVENDNGDDSFEVHSLPSTSSMKCQPQRNCKIKQNLVLYQASETSDESDCDNSEEQGSSSFESDS